MILKKRISCALVALILMLSCRNEKEQKVEPGQSVDTLVTETSSGITTSPYSVEYNEKTQALNLIRSDENLSNADAHDIIRVLNTKYDGLKLELVKASADTISVKINDATKLTQEMGTAGAEAYLAELTFSFTELKGIKAVRVNFEEGDHAMPGVYTREDFKSLKK